MTAVTVTLPEGPPKPSTSAHRLMAGGGDYGVRPEQDLAGSPAAV